MFKFGRFVGFFKGFYRDENVFFILLVIFMYFILFGIFFFKDKWIKIGFIVFILFLWYVFIFCVFRGVLLSVGLLIFFVMILICLKKFNIILLVVFVGVIIW